MNMTGWFLEVRAQRSRNLPASARTRQRCARTSKARAVSTIFRSSQTRFLGSY